MVQREELPLIPASPVGQGDVGQWLSPEGEEVGSKDMSAQGERMAGLGGLRFGGKQKQGKEMG